MGGVVYGRGCEQGAWVMAASADCTRQPMSILMYQKREVRGGVVVATGKGRAVFPTILAPMLRALRPAPAHR